MEDRIRNARLSFTCNQEWEGMKPDADGRFCSSCQKKVYNLRDKNTAYFMQILKENNNNVCGRFSSEQIAKPVRVQYTGWKAWLMTTLAILGLSSCKQENPIAEILDKSVTVVKELEPESWDIVGDVMAVGYLDDVDLKKLTNHLNANLQLPSTTNGHLGVTFILNDGKIEVTTISGKLPKELKKEVTGVFKSGLSLIRDNIYSGFPYQISLMLKNGRVDSVLSQ